MESTPSKVPRPGEATQGGDVRSRWGWVEPSVWTPRMLKALERGVKGDVWFSLIDKVYERRNLNAAFAKVKANKGGPGKDWVTVSAYEQHLDEELDRLGEHLKTGAYEPQPVLRKWIPKGDGKQRPLGIPTVRDRVAQTALRNVLEPIFEREFAEHSYGFRPGRGAKDALGRVKQLLEAGYCHVVDADIQGYFDSIPKARLMSLVRERIADGRVLGLVEQYLNQPVMEALKTWTPPEGTPQGAVISPLLANLYLNPLDHLMADLGVEMTRYADDFVLQCRSHEEAQEALERLRQWMGGAELTLHPDKTRIVSMEEDDSYFDFLGYRFKRHKGRDYRFIRPKSVKKLRESVRKETKRKNGHSLEHIISKLNPTIRGWFKYFQDAHWNEFPPIDGYIRMRLRSILRKRHKGKGRGRGNDHFRWPNAFFDEHGLFSLKAAHDSAIQSLTG